MSLNSVFSTVSLKRIRFLPLKCSTSLPWPMGFELTCDNITGIYGKSIRTRYLSNRFRFIWCKIYLFTVNKMWKYLTEAKNWGQGHFESLIDYVRIFVLHGVIRNNDIKMVLIRSVISTDRCKSIKSSDDVRPSVESWWYRLLIYLLGSLFFIWLIKLQTLQISIEFRVISLVIIICSIIRMIVWCITPICKFSCAKLWL